MAGIGGEIANLIVALKLDDSGFTGKMRGVQGSLGRLQGGFSQMGRGVGQVGRGLDTLGTRAALAAAGGLTAVIKTAASFEQAFTGIEKTVSETANTTFPELEEAIRQMARSIPVSFEELAGIGEAGGALGIAADDLEDFIDVVARLAVSTDLSSEQAATALGQLGNVLHLSGDDFRDFSDSLVALGNAGASTESQIVEIAARFGAAGNAAGLSKEEILALSSAVASMGIEVEAGGSALSRIFNNVATNIGTSSGKAKEFAKTLGLSAAEFKRSWERDALGTFQNFLKELNKLDQFEQASILKKIGITNTRDISAVRLMAQNVGFVNEQLEISEKATGDLNKESQKFFDTATGQWKIMVNNLRDAGATIGNEVLPVFKDLVKEFTGFLNEPGTREGLKSFGKDLAAGIRSLAGELRGTDFSGIIDGMKLAATVAKGAFDAFNALPGPVKQLAIAALIANKVSGGAVGQIAKGLGNIALGGGLLGLGRTPATAMWVRQIGLPGGAGGGLAGGLAKGGFWAGVGKVFGLAAAVTIGAEIGRGLGGLIFDPTVAPAVKFEESQFQKFLNNPQATRDADVIRRNLEAVEDGIYRIAGNTVDGLERWLIPQLAVLEQQRDTLRELLAAAPQAGVGNNVPANMGGTRTQKVFDERNFNEAAASRRLGEERNRIALRSLGLEQRLIQDSNFKKQISGAEFINLLKRTSEFGARGVGTTIEQGRKTGRDPFGEAFLALVKRVKVLTPEVMREVGNHIVAAEEVQSRLLKAGDAAGARRIQRTINALHKIQGTQDRTNAILDRLKSQTHSALSVANRNLATNNQKQERIVTGIREARERIGSGFARSNEQLGVIARKETSFTANITTNVVAHLSTYQALTTLTRVSRIRAGTGFTPTLLNGSP